MREKNRKMESHSKNIQTSGFLVMDTNCFLKYINEQKVEDEKFDYDGVKDFIEKNHFLLLITPYTLYECVQSCDTIEKMRKRSREMDALWDFWVLNVNSIIGKDFGLEAGPDFIFSLRLGIGSPEEYVEKRRELRRKIYEALTPRIILLSQLVAIVYILASEQREDGTYDASVHRRIGYALSGYFQEEQNFKVQMYSFFESPYRLGLTVNEGILEKTQEDAKDSLSKLIHDFAVQILLVTKVIMDEKRLNTKFSWGEFNDRIVKEHFWTAGMYEAKEMRELGRAFLKKNKGQVTIDRYVDETLPEYDSIFKHLYKRVLSDWFERNGAGKQLMNTIIDYANIGMVETINGFPVIYMTEEKKFVELIMGLDEKKLKLTQEFYGRYYQENTLR